MKATKLLFIFLLISGSISAQLTVNSAGQVRINGFTGADATAPRIDIYSNTFMYIPLGGYESRHTGLSLFNMDKTINNMVSLKFSSRLDNDTEQCFAAITTQFKDRSTSNFASDFYILTYNKGVFAPRFIIRNTANANCVNFEFMTSMSGFGNGNIVMDNSGGETTIRPSDTWHGYLGTNNHQWWHLYARKAFFGEHTDVASADIRTKNSIQDIDETLKKITQVRGIKYKLNISSEEIISAKNDDELGYTENDETRKLLQEENEKYIAKKEKELQKEREKERFGFIAQELIEIFPEVVNYNKEEDSYGIQYTALIPILFEGIKEQQAQIEELKAQMQYMQLNCCNTSIIIGKEKDANLEISADYIGTKSDIETVLATATTARLDQNAPNPFKEETKISFFIPNNTKNAGIYIYNLLGTQIKKIEIHQTGEGSILINGSQLTAEIYLYALIIDNQVIDTKKMILTE